MKIFGKKSITIYTIIVLVLAMTTFEFCYCNVNFIKGIINNEEFVYNFSLCRMVIYVLFITLYLIFKNKFVNTALDTMKNKYKRIITYIVIAVAIVACSAIGAYTFYKGLDNIRTGAIEIILFLMMTLFIIYVSNDSIKNTIVTACTFGIIFTFTTNYNHAIDEKKHFMSALNVSFLNFDYIENPITDSEIEKLPQLSKFTGIDEFLKNNYTANVTDEVNKEDIPSTPADYSVTAYLASGMGIAIARSLGGSIIDMYIVGRIMNLTIYTILICIAMKLLPYKKNIFYIIAFMPFMLLLASSYSIDGICLGTIYIFVAYCLKIYNENETISLKQFLIIILLYGIMILGKGIAYMLIGVLIFMLPLYKTIKKNKKYIPIMAVCGIIVIILGTFFVIYIKNMKLSADADTRGGNEINATEQLKIVLTKPILDVKVAINHIKNTLLSFNWYSQLHQNTFFSKDSACTMFVMMLFILYVSLTEDEHNFTIKNKTILILGFLLGYGLSSAILYLTFTTVGSLYIAGYQGRYIFPILPLLLCCISNNKVKCIKTENRNMNIAGGVGIFLIVGLVQLILV